MRNWFRPLRVDKPEPTVGPLDDGQSGRPIDQAEALKEFELGNGALASQRFPLALRHFQRAVSLDPGLAEAQANLGALLKDMGQMPEAEFHLARAVALKPALTPACFNLGLRRIDQRRWAEAAELLQRVLAREPREADAHYWLANALMGMGDMQRARKSYQAASRLKPALVQAQWGYVMAQLPAVAQTSSEQREAPGVFIKELDRLRAAWRNRSPSELYAVVGALQPFHLAYIDGNHRTALQAYGRYCVELMQGWSREAGLPQPKAKSGRKCRLGIVSAHVHSHSVWHALVKGWVQHLDARRFEIHLFHVGSSRDQETDWAGRHAAKLHLGQRSWQDWAHLIAQTQPDVLIYPEIGMDATTVRLASLRLARVQLGSWGHPVTTGLPTIDGYISAEGLEPEHAHEHYTEELMLLPRLGCCYQSFGIKAAQRNGLLGEFSSSDRLLLCAGTPYKYGPDTDELWIELARRCQPCKLIFFRSDNLALTNRLEQRLRQAFKRAGISFDDNVRFIPWQPQAEFFAWLDRADLFLDTVGFSGFNTAMQAIECNTPIVAYEGAYLRGRLTSGILRQMGLGQYVAVTQEQYVQVVQRLLQDEEERQRYRQEIARRKGEVMNDLGAVTALGERLLQLSQAGP
jgi:predicted O-linked N-acetylglucosamine transferase (SPINDLY family)